MVDLAEEGADFAELLGAFGTHANLEKRAKAERLAAMKPSDRRRKRVATRTNQFNTRVGDRTIELAQLLIEEFSRRDGKKWSQADRLERAIAALAEAEGIERGGQAARSGGFWGGLPVPVWWARRPI
jgi:hypothetical protein